MASLFYIGAGATRPSVSYTRDNSELMTNVNVQSNINLSKEAYVGADGKGNLVDYTSLEFSSLANFFASDGKPSQVLKIEARNRTGDLNIVTCMRQALLGHYGKDKQIGLGGVLLIKEGKIKSHIMPAFPPCDLPGTNIEWLRYFEVAAPLTCLSVLVSSDTHDDALRVEHTHFFPHTTMADTTILTQHQKRYIMKVITMLLPISTELEGLLLLKKETVNFK